MKMILLVMFLLSGHKPAQMTYMDRATDKPVEFESAEACHDFAAGHVLEWRVLTGADDIVWACVPAGVPT